MNLDVQLDGLWYKRHYVYQEIESIKLQSFIYHIIISQMIGERDICNQNITNLTKDLQKKYTIMDFKKNALFICGMDVCKVL